MGQANAVSATWIGVIFSIGLLTVVSKQTHGTVDDLESLRHHISQLQADTSDGLKKNVYKHYHQFIETAKEISS